MLVSLHAKIPQMALYSSQTRQLLYISLCIIFLDSPWGIISSRHSGSSSRQLGFLDWLIYIFYCSFFTAILQRPLFSKVNLGARNERGTNEIIRAIVRGVIPTEAHGNDLF